MRHWLQGDSEATLRAELVAFGRLHVRGVTDGMPADEVLPAVRAFVRDQWTTKRFTVCHKVVHELVHID